MSMLFSSKAWEHGSCSRITLTSFLPPLCVLRWAGLHPNWEWKAWLTPSLSFPAAPLFCLGYREVQGVGTLTYNAEASSLDVMPVTKPGTYSQAGLRRWTPLKRRTLRLLPISSQTFGITCGIRLPAFWALKLFFTVLWALEHIFQTCSVIGCEDHSLLGMYILNCYSHHLVISCMHSFMCILALLRRSSSTLYMITKFELLYSNCELAYVGYYSPQCWHANV